jgi:hypothetical protein
MIPGTSLAIDEDGRRAEVADRVDAGGEGEGADEHLVAGTHTCRDQGEVQRRRARGERYRVACPDEFTEFALERIDLCPEGRDPVGPERLGHEALLEPTHVGG